jgi:hypothetical protein
MIIASIVKFTKPDDPNTVEYFLTKARHIRNGVYDIRAKNCFKMPWLHKAQWDIAEQNEVESNHDATIFFTSFLLKHTQPKKDSEEEEAVNKIVVPDHIVKYIKTSNKSDATTKTYCSILRRYMRFCEKEVWDQSLLYDINKIDSFCKEQKSSPTGLLCATLKAIKSYHEEYLQELVNKIKDYSSDGNINKIRQLLLKENKDIPKASDLSEQVQKYKDTNPLLFVIGSLYTLMPPLRSNEWTNCTIVEDYVNNHLSLETGTFIIRNHKRSVRRGDRTVTLPPELMDILRNWCTKSEWLLPSPRDATKPMSPDRLNSHLEKIFGFKVNKLRHFAISSALQKGEDLEAITITMNTSKYVALTTYDDNKTILNV